MVRQLFAYTAIFFTASIACAQPVKNTTGALPDYLLNAAETGAFEIAASGKTAPILIDPDEWKGVMRASNDLADDIFKVTGKAAIVNVGSKQVSGAIIIGTIGKSKLIDELVTSGKLNVNAIKGKWESFLIQTVGKNLVIAGSDKRGTIYGIYDVSEKIGVSPWYWWADAPVKKSSALYVKPGRYLQTPPKVKYRGIFINDESPSFTGWANTKFGGMNAKMYAHLFELLLRLKANYLWPAMWGNAFNEDDPLSPVLADEYGIVMGTSHHEPMMRAQKEYTKRKQDIGPWDYVTNAANLQKFWVEGLERNKGYDNLITLGMRGDGDVAMGKGDDADNIRTLKQVVADQRNIIEKVYDQDPAKAPQLWAIFTEVQRYYDAGLNVPDDVTLLFCDNNWGYIRRTAPAKERNRKGGMGLYYHIDMNGGPWNDRWVNTTTVPKLREQLNLAYQSGLDRIWIVNVGDLKPKEMPIDFIMHYAWNPDAMAATQVNDYLINWATGIFGQEHARQIAEIVSKYSKYNLVRKPEVQDAGIFSLVNYHEAERVLKQWQDLRKKAEDLEKRMPKEALDAYYQLVLYPVKASAGVAEIYLAAGWNNLYAKQGRVSANSYGKRARELFELDKQLSNRYNDSIADKKWKNMMSDVHIGYKQWSMPRQNALPELAEVTPLSEPTLGIAVEGSTAAWPGEMKMAELPQFDALDKQNYYIDIFNRGSGELSFVAKASQPWIRLSSEAGTTESGQRIFVDIDWKSAPAGQTTAMVEVGQREKKIPIIIKILNLPPPSGKSPYYGGYSGEFSVPADKFSANMAGKEAKWIILPDLGRANACVGIFPVKTLSTLPKQAPRLEYKIFLSQADSAKICLGILPTQDVNPARGLRIAVALDDDAPVILDARKGYHDEFKEYTQANLARSQVLKPLPAPGPNYALVSRGKPRRSEVFDNQRWLDVKLPVKKPGIHTLKVYMIDPEIVMERIIINPNDRYPSYFGAPELLHTR